MENMKTLREKFDELVDDNFSVSVVTRMAKGKGEGKGWVKKLDKLLGQMDVEERKRVLREFRRKYKEDNELSEEDKAEVFGLVQKAKENIRENVRNMLLYYYGETEEGRQAFMRSPHRTKKLEEAVDLLMQDVDVWVTKDE